MRPDSSKHENDLVGRCASGEDAGAWDLFVRTYSGLIWSAIHKTFRSSSFRYTQDDAEDVFNALFLSLLDNRCEKLKQFHGRNACTLPTWLTVVTVRRVVDFMRRQRPHRTTSLEDFPQEYEAMPDTNASIEDRLMAGQADVRLRQAIDNLPSPDKALYRILCDDGVSPEAAAKRLGVSLPAFYTRKHRLIERLKKNVNSM